MSSTTASQQDCIQNCQECQITCASMLTSHCLSEGADHGDQKHVKLMLDCIAACSTCVDFMSRNSDYDSNYCKACAEICQACADSCEEIGNMDKCVECCRKCAESCSAMAS